MSLKHSWYQEAHDALIEWPRIQALLDVAIQALLPLTLLGVGLVIFRIVHTRLLERKWEINLGTFFGRELDRRQLALLWLLVTPALIVTVFFASDFSWYGALGAGLAGGVIVGLLATFVQGALIPFAADIVNGRMKNDLRTKRVEKKIIKGALPTFEGRAKPGSVIKAVEEFLADPDVQKLPLGEWTHGMRGVFAEGAERIDELDAIEYLHFLQKEPTFKKLVAEEASVAADALTNLVRKVMWNEDMAGQLLGAMEADEYLQHLARRDRETACRILSNLVDWMDDDMGSNLLQRSKTWKMLVSNADVRTDYWPDTAALDIQIWFKENKQMTANAGLGVAFWRR